jgi:hypothetical protein
VLPREAQERVNAAIDKGVKYLRGSQRDKGHWQGGPAVGVTALAALTLLECGVKPDAPEVQKAVAFLRSEAAGTSDDQTGTYQVSAAILLLDRLGDKADEALIQSLALRLIVSQRPAGAWSYSCPAVLKAADEQNLLAVLRHTRPAHNLELFMSGPNTFLPAAAGLGLSIPPGRMVDPDAPFRGVLLKPLPGDAKAEAARRALVSLPEEARKAPALLPPSLAAVPAAEEFSDNSNTQFAALALQAAGRHGVPVERSLGRVVRRFRSGQQKDGSWGYDSTEEGTGTPSMTCAGLIALAIGHGLVAPAQPMDEDRGRVKDPRVQAGLLWISQIIGNPMDAGGRPDNVIVHDRKAATLYFLWSLERVGVMYNLPRINGKDWYSWGADLLVKSQGGDGRWELRNSPGSSDSVDTCFALLFLKRANLAKDVTLKIQNKLELLEEDKPKK